MIITWIQIHPRICVREDLHETPIFVYIWVNGHYFPVDFPLTPWPSDCWHPRNGSACSSARPAMPRPLGCHMISTFNSKPLTYSLIVTDSFFYLDLHPGFLQSRLQYSGRSYILCLEPIWAHIAFQMTMVAFKTAVMMALLQPIASRSCPGIFHERNCVSELGLKQPTWWSNHLVTAFRQPKPSWFSTAQLGGPHFECHFSVPFLEVLWLRESAARCALSALPTLCCRWKGWYFGYPQRLGYGYIMYIIYIYMYTHVHVCRCLYIYV